MNLGEKITLRLQQLHKSDRQAAKESGLSPTFIGEVRRGSKSLGIESAKKLAVALEWPVSELLGTDAATVQRWFWSMSIGALRDAELAALRKADAQRGRLAWTLQQVRAHFPDLDLAAAGITSSEHVDRLLAAQGNISGELLANFAAALNLPPHWLTLGEPGPSEAKAQKVLQHHNAEAWLDVVSEAIDQNIPPGKIRLLIQTYAQMAGEKN